MNQQQEQTDEQLVRQYINGNDAAFDVLLARYESKIYSYIFYAVHDEEQAQDLFQDIFVRIVCQLKSGKYNDMNKFASWLMRITHNRVIDYHRRNHAENFVSNDDQERDPLNNIAVATEDNREREIISQQTLRDVRQLIAMLPQSQREVVLMRYYDELSFKEIALRTGTSINTALGRMRYALINLRRLAKTYDVELAG